MKTTIEISDTLLREALEVAAREGVTLRALVERGLHRVLSETPPSGAPFKLRNVAFEGHGLQTEFQGPHWSRTLDAVYEGRGG
jgi:hypothetical protein